MIYIFLGVLSVIATHFITHAWFGWIDQPWRSVLAGLVCVMIFLVLLLIKSIIKAANGPKVQPESAYIKAMNDTDLQVASELGMPVDRYRQYREWYDEHQRLMQEYGIGSKEETEYFKSFFKQVKVPNEWRRYQDFRYQLDSPFKNGGYNPNTERIEKIESLLNKDRSICDFINMLDGWRIDPLSNQGLRIMINPIVMPEYALYITYREHKPTNDETKILYDKLTSEDSIVTKAHKMNMPVDNYIDLYGD